MNKIYVPFQWHSETWGPFLISLPGGQMTASLEDFAKFISTIGGGGTGGNRPGLKAYSTTPHPPPSDSSFSNDPNESAVFDISRLPSGDPGEPGMSCFSISSSDPIEIGGTPPEGNYIQLADTALCDFENATFTGGGTAGRVGGSMGIVDGVEYWSYLFHALPFNLYYRPAITFNVYSFHVWELQEDVGTIVNVIATLAIVGLGMIALNSTSSTDDGAASAINAARKRLRRSKL